VKDSRKTRFARDTKVDRSRLFDVVVAEDVLPKVLTRYRLVPVVGTSGNTGPWDQPGSVRTVHLAGGASAREKVTAFERPTYFAYRLSDFTFAIRWVRCRSWSSRSVDRRRA